MALSKIVENSLADEAVSSAKLKDFSAAVDLNGVELVLDADADTSITADTDDRIDFKIAGVEHFSFSNSSGDTIIKPMVDAKDIKFQQFDGRTLLDINDGGFVGIANGATSSGEIRFFEDTDNGSNYIGLNAGSISSSFTLTLPTADGSSGQFLKTDGSGALSFDTVSSAADDLTTGDAAVTIATSSGNITIDAQGGDTDIIFKGTDGSSDITPMTLDMSDAGALFLTGGKIDLKNSGTRSKILFYCESSNAHAQTLQAAPHSESASNTLTLPSTGGDVDLVSTASTATLTNKTLTTPTIAQINAADFLLDASGDITLDAGGADINLKDDGTRFGILYNSSSNFYIEASVQDKDIKFLGNDGGSGITALSLDMSEAGAATFNGAITGGGLLTTGGNIVIPDSGNIGSASDTDAIAIAANGVTTFSQAPVLSGASISAGTVPATALDIDGATDIGADIVDADLFLIDDGAGGTNRKVAASRIKTYAATTSLSGLNVTINGITQESGTLATGDELLIYDASADANRRINVANFLKSAANRTTTSIGTSISAQPNTTVTYGNTIAGSNIVYSHTSTAVGSGTWRAMGTAANNDRTVFLRIS